MRQNEVASCVTRALEGLVQGSQMHQSPGIDPQPKAPARKAFDPSQLKSIDDLLDAFSNGFIPDLNQRTQRDAFELYRRMRFGDPDTHLYSDAVDEIAEEMRKHPELKKDPFRNYQLDSVEKSYPVTRELSSFLDSQVLSAGQVRANLFQIDANSGFWKKILQYSDSDLSASFSKSDQIKKESMPEEKAAFREKSKLEKEQSRLAWLNFINQRVPSDVRNSLADLEQPVIERATSLYRLLYSERNRLKTEKKDLRPITQAMVDLIHTIGYHDPMILKSLKSENGMERINAYRKVLDERDRFSMELGFEDHFDQVIRVLGNPEGIRFPSGMASANGISETLEKLEQGLIQSAENSGSSAPSVNHRTIRHLSLIESPFRSCLGGSDCSSRTYLSRALDPNYHYFTITDERGASSGQVTVVLGTGEIKGKSVKIAFLDKVQNVPNQDLPRMIEGVRRSLEEKGYVLVVPDEPGDHNGISNNVITRSFIKSHIKTDRSQFVTGFRPHRHSYDFPAKFSRAEDSLLSHVISPLNLTDDIVIRPGDLIDDWKMDSSFLGTFKDLDIQELVRGSIQLKNSPNLEDRIRYIHSMKVIKQAGLQEDPEFENVQKKWLSDPHQSLQLRKQVLIHRWINQSVSLRNLLSSFNKSEKVQILQNLLDTPRYFERISGVGMELPHYLVMTRKNKKVRAILLDLYSRERRNVLGPLATNVLDDPNLSDEAIIAILASLKTGVLNQNFREMIHVENLVKGLDLEPWSHSKMIQKYIESIPGEISLGQDLARTLGSNDGLYKNFGKRLFSEAEKSQHQNTLVLAAFREVLKIQSSNRFFSDFTKAAESWMASKNVDPDLKSAFLLSHFSIQDMAGDSVFKKMKSLIPEQQSDQVMKKINQGFNFNVFEKIIEEQSQAEGIQSRKKSRDRSDSLYATRLFQKGKLESFKFISQEFPKEGKKVRLGSPSNELGRDLGEELHDVTFSKPFEIQATPVTQLQWIFVMGENPSTNVWNSPFFKLEGGQFRVNPNCPVEKVSWDDVQEFIRRMNDLDPHYEYRLPTESEWEYVARAGTDTPYFFGNDPHQLEEYAWHQPNAGLLTHDVASLKANPFGVFDIYGNVGEWVQDRWGRYPSTTQTENMDQNLSENFRAYRGGSLYDDPLLLRSARRNFVESNMALGSVGFRLVRVPKEKAR